MTPTQFLARLSALVPPPRHPLVRFYGVWAPHHRWRSSVVMATLKAKQPRGRAIGLLQSGTAAGALVGPLAGGFLSSQWGFAPILLTTAALIALAGALAASVLEADSARRRWRAHATVATASYAIGLGGLIGGVLLPMHRDSPSRATTVNIADLSLELARRFSPHGAMLRGTF